MRQLAIFGWLFLGVSIMTGQEAESKQDSLHFLFEPDSLYLEVGESATIKISLLTEDDQLSQNAFFIYSGIRKAVSAHPRISDSTGVAVVEVRAHRPGQHVLKVRSISVKRTDRVEKKIPVEVPYPPINLVEFNDPVKKLYAGTTIHYSVTAYDETDLIRDDVRAALSTSDKTVAQFDRFGNLTAHRPGRVTLRAEIEEAAASLPVRVMKSPVRGIELSSPVEEARTGDVVQFTAKALASRAGQVVRDAPVKFSFTGRADYGEGLPASGQITEDGRFVAETAGLYTIYANSGGYSASKTIGIVPRNVRKQVELVGHGLVKDFHTSDLWVWAGVGEFTGRDFAATGTWGANGETYFWEVTDPANLVIIDTVTVDARTVNDVKVSADGRIAVITREGASNRKNGFVILDVANPFDVKILSEFNHDMTGGVHNAFIYDHYVYAVNNGRKFDVINIEDPIRPYRVGVYELDSPGHSIHDVWIEDGIAYTSNWQDGVHAIDVGGLARTESNTPLISANPLLRVAGQGSPTDPVPIAQLEDTTGRNHAAFPYLSQSTGKFYIVAGDEDFPTGFNASEERISKAAGGFHFMDFSDISNAHEAAIYQVPEAGAHNLWVKGDTLYAAFYQGGLRVLDISGDLLGDLYAQGREIAFYLSESKEGVFANAPMVWGPQPYKDLIFFSDFHSGLYALRLVTADKKPDTN